jgi:hypothetical protein
MDFKAHLETAWNMTLKYIASLIIVTLVMVVVSFFSLGFLAPVTMAGYMQAVLLMLREGREPKVQDLFSHMRLFFPLLGFSIIVFIAVLIGYLLLILPGILLMVAVSFCCLYMLPLMTDRNSGLIDAIKESYSMTVKGNTVDNIAVFIIFIGLVFIGSSVFIGCLFTQPFATIFLLSVYEEKIKQTPAEA